MAVRLATDRSSGIGWAAFVKRLKYLGDSSLLLCWLSECERVSERPHTHRLVMWHDSDEASGEGSNIVMPTTHGIR